MLKQYETVFIVTPVLSDAQMKETVKKYADLITSNGGEMVSQEDWGLKKLAYPIENKTTGYYNLFEYKCDSSFIQTLEIQFGRDAERIIRHLTVALDKDAVAYAEHRRSKRSARNTAPESEPDSVVDAVSEPEPDNDNEPEVNEEA